MKKNYTNLEMALMTKLANVHAATNGEHGEGLNLGGREWVAYTFRGLDLTGADVTGAQFKVCNFTGCNLAAAQGLETATFEGCKFDAQTKGVTVENHVRLAPAATEAPATEPTTADVTAAIEAAPATEPETVTVTEAAAPTATKRK